MNIRLIALCLWISALAASAEEGALPSPIVIPDSEHLVERELSAKSRMTPERRTAVTQRIAKAFAEAERVGIVSLKPSSREMLELWRPAMVRHLRKRLFAGYACYGSGALDAEFAAAVSKAVVDAIETPLTPRLGLCWAPRHAIVIRKAPEQDVVLELCCECGGHAAPGRREGAEVLPSDGNSKGHGRLV